MSRVNQRLQRQRLVRTAAGAVVAAVGVAVAVLAVLKGQAQFIGLLPLVLVGFGLGIAQPELMARTLRIVLRAPEAPAPPAAPTAPSTDTPEAS